MQVLRNSGPAIIQQPKSHRFTGFVSPAGDSKTVRRDSGRITAEREAADDRKLNCAGKARPI